MNKADQKLKDALEEYIATKHAEGVDPFSIYGDAMNVIDDVCISNDNIEFTA